MMSMLLEHLAVDPNARDNEGRTALGRAICSAQPSLVKAMLSRNKTNPNQTVSKGPKTPLGLVVSLCRERNSPQLHEIARLLLDTGKVDPQAKTASGHCPLQEARPFAELVEIMESDVRPLATGKYPKPSYSKGFAKS